MADANEKQEDMLLDKVGAENKNKAKKQLLKEAVKETVNKLVDKRLNERDKKEDQDPVKKKVKRIMKKTIDKALEIEKEKEREKEKEFFIDEAVAELLEDALEEKRKKEEALEEEEEEEKKEEKKEEEEKEDGEKKKKKVLKTKDLPLQHVEIPFDKINKRNLNDLDYMGKQLANKNWLGVVKWRKFLRGRFASAKKLDKNYGIYLNKKYLKNHKRPIALKLIEAMKNPDQHPRIMKQPTDKKKVAAAIEILKEEVLEKEKEEREVAKDPNLMRERDKARDEEFRKKEYDKQERKRARLKAKEDKKKAMIKAKEDQKKQAEEAAKKEKEKEAKIKPMFDLARKKERIQQHLDWMNYEDQKYKIYQNFLERMKKKHINDEPWRKHDHEAVKLYLVHLGSNLQHYQNYMEKLHKGEFPMIARTLLKRLKFYDEQIYAPMKQFLKKKWYKNTEEEQSSREARDLEGIPKYYRQLRKYFMGPRKPLKKPRKEIREKRKKIREEKNRLIKELPDYAPGARMQVIKALDNFHRPWIKEHNKKMRMIRAQKIDAVQKLIDNEKAKWDKGNKNFLKVLEQDMKKLKQARGAQILKEIKQAKLLMKEKKSPGERRRERLKWFDNQIKRKEKQVRAQIERAGDIMAPMNEKEMEEYNLVLQVEKEVKAFRDAVKKRAPNRALLKKMFAGWKRDMKKKKVGKIIGEELLIAGDLEDMAKKLRKAKLQKLKDMKEQEIRKKLVKRLQDDIKDLVRERSALLEPTPDEPEAEYRVEGPTRSSQVIDPDFRLRLKDNYRKLKRDYNREAKEIKQEPGDELDKEHRYNRLNYRIKDDLKNLIKQAFEDKFPDEEMKQFVKKLRIKYKRLREKKPVFSEDEKETVSYVDDVSMRAPTTERLQREKSKERRERRERLEREESREKKEREESRKRKIIMIAEFLIKKSMKSLYPLYSSLST